MIIATDIRSTREYELKGQEEATGKKTTATIGLIDSQLYSWIEDETTSFGVSQNGSRETHMKVNLSQRNWYLVRFGVRGWQNLVRKDGTEVQAKLQSVTVPGIGVRTGLTQESMDLVGSLVQELAHEVYRDNTMSEQDQKN